MGQVVDAAEAYMMMVENGTKLKKPLYGNLDALTEQQQYMLDTAMWYGTVENADQAIMSFLARLFTTLMFGNLHYRDKKGKWIPWKNCGIPICSSISHGGRVLLQLPNIPAHAAAYWSWLWGNGLPAALNPAQHTRQNATHDIARSDKPETISLGMPPKRVKETGAAMGTKDPIHFGINLPMGGDGNLNPFSGNVITADGQHGHLYIAYRQSISNSHGAILIGCEDSAPSDVWHGKKVGAKAFLASKLGGKDDGIMADGKTRFAFGQSGHAHKFGGSGTYSATGGRKWKDAKWHQKGPMSSKDSMFCDVPPSLIGKLDTYWAEFNAIYLGWDAHPKA